MTTNLYKTVPDGVVDVDQGILEHRRKVLKAFSHFVQQALNH